MTRKRHHGPPAVSTGDQLEIVPEKLIAGGDSLARVDGFPLFVAGIYPGDRALVRVTEVRKGFGRGELIELISPSPLRRTDPCPVSRECGGCNWTELRLDAQLRAKREILLESIERIGRVPVAEIPAPRIHASPLNYRLRSRLHVGPEGDLGFFASRSHRVVPLPDSCEVVGPMTLAIAPQARVHSDADSVIFFESDGGLQTLELPQQDEDQVPLTTVRAGGRRWVTPLDGFFQVNRHLLETMQRLVISIAYGCRSRELAWDLYGGSGFFAEPLSRLFRNVVSVESSPGGHHSARMNLADLEGAEPLADDVEHFVRRGGRPDLVFLDPPRAGAAEGVVSAIGELSPEVICYLSCDPVTFSRDVSRLLRRGWRVTELHLLDLFPNTHHVETLAALRRD